MHHVRSPEEAALVADPVEPVVAEFVTEEEQRPGPPLKPNRKNRKAMQPGEDAELERLGEQVDENIAEAHGDAGSGIFYFVNVAPHDGASDGFHKKQDDKRRNRQCNQVTHMSRGAESISLQWKRRLRSRILHPRGNLRTREAAAEGQVRADSVRWWLG